MFRVLSLVFCVSKPRPFPFFLFSFYYFPIVLQRSRMRQNFLIRSPVLFRRHTSRLNSLPSLLGTSPSSQNSILLFPGRARAPSGIPSGLSYCFSHLMADPSVSHSSPSCPALIKFSMSSLRVIFLSSPFYVVVFFLFK